MKKPELCDARKDKITVLLAEDHGAYRKSLKLLVESDSNIEVIGEAKNGRGAVRLNKSLRPDVIVMDIAMPLMNGLQASQEIRETSPKTRILILSAHPEPEYIKQAVICGASGYLIKQSSAQALAQAVREVFEGNPFFCAPIAKPLRNECQKLFGQGELLKKRTAQAAILAEAGN
jgi:DNA-binding NarL/FixJ family response regulator